MKRIAMLVPIAVLLVSCTSTQSSETSSHPPGGAVSASATLQSCPDAITWDRAPEHVGERAAITGPTISTVYAADSRGKPTFLNIGKPCPDHQRFTVVIWGYDRDNFPTPPEMKYDNTTICITGLIETYKWISQITADAASDIEIVE